MHLEESVYPPKLTHIIEFFESLSSLEKRENLIVYADQVLAYKPDPSVKYDVVDIRKDQECLDSVGIHLKVSPDNTVSFAIELGEHVQTLTKALASILCEGLENSKLDIVLNLPQDFIPKLVGSELVRARSQTIYYVLTRIKDACKQYQRRTTDLL